MTRFIIAAMANDHLSRPHPQRPAERKRRTWVIWERARPVGALDPARSAQPRPRSLESGV